MDDSMSSFKKADVWVKFICDIERDIVKPEYIESRLMMADLLKKALSELRVKSYIRKVMSR